MSQLKEPAQSQIQSSDFLVTGGKCQSLSKLFSADHWMSLEFKLWCFFGGFDGAWGFSSVDPCLFILLTWWCLDRKRYDRPCQTGHSCLMFILCPGVRRHHSCPFGLAELLWCMLCCLIWLFVFKAPPLVPMCCVFCVCVLFDFVFFKVNLRTGKTLSLSFLHLFYHPHLF